jgi:hypothetical protein
MSVQQQLLEKIGEGLVKQFKDSIAPVRASGRTADSIHAVATDSSVEVLADRHIWALEDGRSPTRNGAKASNPTLFERIKEWAQIRGIVSNVNDPKELGIVYAITKKIHKKGWKPTLDKPLTKVIQSIDEDSLLRELVASQVTIYNDRVVKSVKEL